MLRQGSSQLQKYKAAQVKQSKTNSTLRKDTEGSSQLQECHVARMSR